MDTVVKKIFALTIYNAEKKVNKRWFVRVKVPDFVKGCFVWRKCYGDINKYHTVQERQEAAEKLVQEIILTQNYKILQGSRKPGYVSEKFHTDTIFQFNKQLQIRSHRIRHSSYRKYAAMIKNLEIWLLKSGKKNLPLGAFSQEHAHAFLHYLLIDCKLSHQSYNSHLQLFKSFFKELIVCKTVAGNPFIGIEGMSRNNVPALYFQAQQVTLLKGIISHRDKQLWLFIQFIYYCFIRPGELRQLKVKDIIFSEGKIIINPSISKNKKQQFVSIPQVFLNELKLQGINSYPGDNYIFGNCGMPGLVPLAVNSMKNRHQPILKELQFDTRHKLYSWKHTGAIACAKSGMPLKDLQMQLRHHSLDQVNTYLAGMLVYESDFIKNCFPEL